MMRYIALEGLRPGGEPGILPIAPAGWRRVVQNFVDLVLGEAAAP